MEVSSPLAWASFVQLEVSFRLYKSTRLLCSVECSKWHVRLSCPVNRIQDPSPLALLPAILSMMSDALAVLWIRPGRGMIGGVHHCSSEDDQTCRDCTCVEHW